MNNQCIEKNFYLFLIDAIACALEAQQGENSLPKSTLTRASILSSIFALECCANILLSDLGKGKFFQDVDKLPFLSKFEMYVVFKTDAHIDRGRITLRESEILHWSAEGKSVTVIATILSISENSVKFHLKNIYKKLDVTDRLQAVVKAIFLGLINPANIRNLQTLPMNA